MQTKKLTMSLELFHAAVEDGVQNGNSILATAGPLLHDSYQGVVKHLSDFFGGISSHMSSLSSHKNVYGFMKDVDYAAIDNIDVPVPEGFKGDIVGYAEYLMQCVTLSGKISHSLDGIVRQLSVVITNPKMPQETVDFFAKDHSGLKHIVDLNKSAGAYLDPDVSRAALPYGKVIKRNAAWSMIENQVDTLERELMKIDRKNLLTKAADVDRLLGKLIDMHKTDVTLDIDRQWVKQLADSVYWMSMSLEFFSVTYYRCMAYFTSVDAIAKKMKQVAG